MISIGTNASALMAQAATASVQIDAETAINSNINPALVKTGKTIRLAEHVLNEYWVGLRDKCFL